MQCSRCGDADPNCNVCHDKPTTEPDTMKHYQPRFCPESKTWGYTTPTGEVDRIESEKAAWRFARANETQDRETAEIGVGPFAKILSNYFAAQEVAA